MAAASYLLVGAAEFEAEEDRLLDAMDQPSIDGINCWLVSKAAAKQGLKVALSGLGGDELFGSYPSFEQIPALVSPAGALRGAPWVGRTLPQVSAPVSAASPRRNMPACSNTAAISATLPAAARPVHPWELPALARCRAGPRGLALARSPDPAAPVPGRHRQRAGEGVALELTWYMRGQLFARRRTGPASRISVEVRPPLVDTGLLRRLAPLAGVAAARRPRAISRTALRAAARGPGARRKTGFTVPVAELATAGAPAGGGGACATGRCMSTARSSGGMRCLPCCTRLRRRGRHRQLTGFPQRRAAGPRVEQLVVLLRHLPAPPGQPARPHRAASSRAPGNPLRLAWRRRR